MYKKITVFKNIRWVYYIYLELQRRSETHHSWKPSNEMLSTTLVHGNCYALAPGFFCLSRLWFIYTKVLSLMVEPYFLKHRWLMCITCQTSMAKRYLSLFWNKYILNTFILKNILNFFFCQEEYFKLLNIKEVRIIDSLEILYPNLVM